MKTIILLVLSALSVAAQCTPYFDPILRKLACAQGGGGGGWTRTGTDVATTNSGDTVTVGTTEIDPVTGITTPRVAGPAGTPVEIGGACQAAGSITTPASGEYTLFLDSANSCHLLGCGLTRR